MSRILATVAALAVILPVSAHAADTAAAAPKVEPHQVERASMNDPRLSATEDNGVSSLSDNEASTFNNVAPASGDEEDGSAPQGAKASEGAAK